MRKNKPLAGLLLYFWYSTGGKLILLFAQVIAWGVAFLVFGDGAAGSLLFIFFGINAVMGVSILIISGMGNREIDWERFQLSMPVRRRHMASSQYLSVGLAPLIGVPIFAAFTALSLVFHDGGYLFWQGGGYSTWLSVYVSIAPYLAMPYIMAALVFPVYMLPVADKLHEGLFPAVMLISVVIPQLVIRWAGRMGWPMVWATSLTLGVSLIIFVVSYFVTRRLYARHDF